MDDPNVISRESAPNSYHEEVKQCAGKDGYDGQKGEMQREVRKLSKNTRSGKYDSQDKKNFI
jgi:hypothetical protein